MGRPMMQRSNRERDPVPAGGDRARAQVRAGEDRGVHGEPPQLRREEERERGREQAAGTERLAKGATDIRAARDHRRKGARVK